MKPEAPKPKIHGLATTLTIAIALAAAATPASPALAQETEINWATFWVGTNPLKPWGDLLIEGFNAQYAGQYKLVTEEIPGDKQYRDKLRADAVADALPDLITGNVTLMRDMRDSGRVVNLTPHLEADPEWSGSFFEDAFESYIAPDGNLYALPYSRDYIGIYYNEALFEEAGVEAFPTTWDEFFAACETFSEAGITAMATEGDWTTRLMWANMIGTQPGGAEWLNQLADELDFVDVEPVVAGTELLREMVQRGCTNEDAFTGQYATGATLFLQGEAAMFANGPWMIPNIAGVNTETAEGLYDNVDYALSPGTEDGRGMMIVTGEAGFAVGAQEEDEIAGAIAFLKYLTSDEQMLNQAQLVSRFGPTDMALTEEQMATLDPMLLKIVADADAAAATYPHTGMTLSNAVIQEFINTWPVYAKGDMETEEFLEILEDSQD